MESARVPGFAPSTSGFMFSNSFPSGIPVVTIPIPGTGATIPLGDASNGVCGGMVYGVHDLFLAEPRLRVPPDTTPPGGRARTRSRSRSAQQVTANIVTGAYQIPGRFLFHAGHGNRDHLTQV